VTSPPNPQANYVLVESLGSSIQRGGNALADVPGLLKRVLAEGAWRTFTTRRGELVEHDRFPSFVITPPLRGLGADMELINRIVGTADTELLRLLKAAKSVGQGARTDLSPCVDSTRSRAAEDTANTADRLARDAPDEYEAVSRGERSIHAAAVRAGIRRRRIPVRLDSAESAARSLRAHMRPETRRALARLLMED